MSRNPWTIDRRIKVTQVKIEKLQKILDTLKAEKAKQESDTKLRRSVLDKLTEALKDKPVDQIQSLIDKLNGTTPSK